MTWGCTITNARVEWRRSNFSLAVERLRLIVDTNSNKVPVMGRSGMGKSTLLNLMAALMWPIQGKVSWIFPDDTTMEWSSDRRSRLSVQRLTELRRRRFGFVFQDSTLIPHLSVEENLIYPLRLQGKTTRDAYDAARMELQRVLVPDEENVEKLLLQFPRQLSVGQRQRVALVQALIHNPDVLFADEPTGSLDLETRQEVMKVVDEWLDKEPGKRLLIWVTHHTDDPEQAEVTRRLHVANGICCWQTRRQKNWQDEETP